MQHPLTPHEKAVLDDLEVSLRADPEFVEHVEHADAAAHRHRLPSARLLTWVGGVFLALGLVLVVESSIWFGLACLAAAVARSPQARQYVVRISADFCASMKASDE